MANTISVNVVADVNGIRNGINNVNSQLNGFQRTASKVGGALKGMFAGAAILGGAQALGSFFSSAVEEGREAAKVTALTEAVIKSMGNSAGISADGVGKLAESLSNKTAIDDEVIQSGANLVLTFGNIKNAAGAGNDVFNQTVAAANDMSVALGQDMKSSSIQLGKALNDPIKGVTALTRVGVSFTEQQKEQIKSMVAAGDTLGAQKVILAEVNKQFGGAAEAAATPMEKLKVSIGNLKESIGTALIPILDRIAEYLVAKLPGWIETAKGAFDKLKTTFETIKPSLETLVTALGTVGGFIKDNMSFFGPFAAILLTVAAAVKIWTAAQTLLNIVLTANPISLVIIAIAALVAGLIFAYKNSETFRNVVNAAFNAVKTVAMTVFNFLKSFIPDTFNSIKSTASSAVNAMQSAVSNGWNAIKNVTSSVWNGLKSIVSSAWSAIRSAVSSGLSTVTSAMTSGWNAAKNTVTSAWNSIKSAVSGGISGVVAAVRALPGAISGALGNLSGILVGAGKSIVQGLINGVTSMIGSLRAKFSSITAMIPDWKGPLPKDKKLLYGAGSAIMGGLIKGISDEERALQRQLTHVTDIIGGTSANIDLAAGAYGANAGMVGSVINVNVEVSPTADKSAIGREVVSAIKAYETMNTARWRSA